METIIILDKFKDDHIDVDLFIRIQELAEKALQVKTDSENTSKDLNKLETLGKSRRIGILVGIKNTRRGRKTRSKVMRENIVSRCVGKGSIS